MKINTIDGGLGIMSFIKKTIFFIACSLLCIGYSLPLIGNIGEEMMQIRKDINLLSGIVKEFKDSDVVERSRKAAIEVFDKGLNHNATVSIPAKTLGSTLGFAAALAGLYLFFNGVNTYIDNKWSSQTDPKSTATNQGVAKTVVGLTSLVAGITSIWWLNS